MMDYASGRDRTADVQQQVILDGHLAPHLTTLAGQALVLIPDLRSDVTSRYPPGPDEDPVAA